MLHFAVCDDEPYMLDRLSAQISECLAELDCRDFRLSRFSGGQALLEAGERFDLVFLDPPYQAGLLEPALALLTGFDILNPHGIIVAEHPADRVMEAPEAPYCIRRTYRYGKIGLTVFRRSGNEENEEQLL